VLVGGDRKFRPLIGKAKPEKLVSFGAGNACELPTTIRLETKVFAACKFICADIIRRHLTNLHPLNFFGGGAPVARVACRTTSLATD
jgi:hypothetical protein